MIKEIKYLIEQTINFNPVDYDEDDEIIISDQDISNVVYKYRPTTYIELKAIVNNLLEKGITDLNCIDVSAITDFSYLFAYKKGYKNKNENKSTIELYELDISDWDVSNGINFSNMFYQQNMLHKCDLSKWDVSKGIDFSYMFNGCSKLKTDISDWDFSNAETFKEMLIGCHYIKHNVYNQDKTNVKDYLSYFPNTKEELQIILKKMYFFDDRNFNMIDVSKITDFSDLFNDPDFKNMYVIAIDKWNVSNGNFFMRMFKNRTTLKADVSKWDVSNGIIFTEMFYGCEDLFSDFSNWDVSNGVLFSSMFHFCSSLNSDFSKWNVSNGQFFNHMFHNCHNLNCDFSKWDMSNTKECEYMFTDCHSLKTDLSYWDLSNVSKKNNMFDDAPYIKKPINMS